ncbi:unnamed protein product [Urochloa humidicola]
MQARVSPAAATTHLSFLFSSSTSASSRSFVGIQDGAARARQSGLTEVWGAREVVRRPSRPMDPAWDGHGRDQQPLDRAQDDGVVGRSTDLGRAGQQLHPRARMLRQGTGTRGRSRWPSSVSVRISQEGGPILGRCQR